MVMGILRALKVLFEKDEEKVSEYRYRGIPPSADEEDPPFDSNKKNDKKFYYKELKPSYYGLQGLRYEYGETTAGNNIHAFLGWKSAVTVRVNFDSSPVNVYIPEKAVLISEQEYMEATERKATI